MRAISRQILTLAVAPFPNKRFPSFKRTKVGIVRLDVLQKRIIFKLLTYPKQSPWVDPAKTRNYYIIKAYSNDGDLRVVGAEVNCHCRYSIANRQ